MKRKKISTTSSGNVFRDLGLPNPEKRLAKAELARQINNLIKQKNLTQVEAAKFLGIDQPKISCLNKGNLSGFSLERLFKFLNILGQAITIKVTKARSKKKSNVSVSVPTINKGLIIKQPSNAIATAIHARKKSR